MTIIHELALIWHAVPNKMCLSPFKNKTSFITDFDEGQDKISTMHQNESVKSEKELKGI